MTGVTAYMLTAEGLACQLGTAWMPTHLGIWPIDATDGAAGRTPRSCAGQVPPPSSQQAAQEDQQATHLEVWRVKAGGEAQALRQPQCMRQIYGPHEAAVHSWY